MTPTVKLKSGLVVANFSSPHRFKFTTGEVLDAVDPAESKRLELKAIEREMRGIRGTKDIRLEFEMTATVLQALQNLEDDESIDVVLVPLPVMTALKAGEWAIGKARTCRVADRVTKEIHPDVFCI